MSTASPGELVRKNATLVALPGIVSKLNELINSPESTTEELIRVIDKDTSLSTTLLKVVNSPFYSFPTKIDSVNLAVTILGTHQLRDLVISIAIIRQFNNNKALSHFDHEAFWCHSITAATAARMTSLALNLRENELCFVAGLLHDIGKLAMHILFPMETKQLAVALNKDPVHTLNAEQEIFGFDHATLGAELLNAWYFPENLVAAVACHHVLQADNRFSDVAAITHIANVVANNLFAPFSADDDNVMAPRALEILGLTESMLEKIHEDTYEHMDEMLQLLYYDNCQ